jgi:hypothetical protein
VQPAFVCRTAAETLQVGRVSFLDALHGNVRVSGFKFQVSGFEF